MVRPLRIQFPGAHQHVISRGNARQRVFHDDHDHLAFLDLVGETCCRFDWHLHAHCLMPNHYHLLVETRHANLSEGMRHLNGVFTQRYNRRRSRVGHLFQGRFKSRLVASERYRWELARYIVLNPVRAGLVAAPEAWRWSSLAWTTLTRPAPSWADPRPLLRLIDPDPRRAAREFARLVAVADVPSPKDRPLDDEVRQAVSRQLAAARGDTEHPIAARHADRPSLTMLLGPASDGRRRRLKGPARAARDAAIRAAVRKHRYRQVEVAAHLGLSSTMVSLVLRRSASNK